MMTESEERAWMLGERAGWVQILRQAIKHLGYSDDIDDGLCDKHRYILEREAAIAQLRMLCEEFGDNDWEPSLHIADIIEKHLGRHLEIE